MYSIFFLSGVHVNTLHTMITVELFLYFIRYTKVGEYLMYRVLFFSKIYMKFKKIPPCWPIKPPPSPKIPLVFSFNLNSLLRASRIFSRRVSLSNIWNVKEISLLHNSFICQSTKSTKRNQDVMSAIKIKKVD